MTVSKAPNPFECARRIIGVNVMLKPDDIVQTGVTLGDAERWLDDCASIIAAEMLSAGIRAAVEIIKQQEATS
jgi:hypothetical protein